MTNSLHQVTQDIQARVRDLAYMMWESAGRHQGMALDYWLAAEKEVLTTFQAAAEMMLPTAKEPSEGPDTPAQPQPTIEADPASGAAAAASEAPAAETAAKPEVIAQIKQPAAKPATRRSGSRSKTTV